MTYQNRWSGILLLGAPGIGKGTQARLLAQDPAYKHIESSVLLREFAKAYPHECRSEPIHAMFEETGALKTPKLLEDHILFSVIQERLTMMELSGRYNPAKQLMLLDGVIRTLPQAKMFDSLLEIPLCVYFDESHFTPDDLRQRWESRQGKESFENFVNRHIEFAVKSDPIKEFYLSQGRMHTLNALQSIDAVAAEFSAIASQYLRT